MVGKTVSHYEIVSELGQGGMGVVYKAKDTMLERTVALKFLPPMFSRDEDAKKRFIHEARAVSALDHPNVAVVHEIGGTDAEQLFIVMAYYDGQTLEDIIAEGDISLDDAVSYTLDTAKGLSAAHAKGIVHRDIKPGNVMVTESGLLKILDFGLAKVQDVTMTMGAKSLGTLAYMSPEQAQGNLVDGRTDLWALGVVFYEMLAGKRPFDGPYDAAILYAAAHEAHESVATWRTDAPEHLVAIVDKLLQKKPADRYQSADDLIGDLESLTAPTPSIMSSVIAPVSDASTADVSEAVHTPKKDLKKVWMMVGALVIVVLGALGWNALSGPSVDPSALETNREQAKQFLDSGIDYLNQGNYQLALAEFERSREIDSLYVPTWTSLSGVYYQLKNYPLAVRSAQKAISLDSTYSGPYYNLGLALAAQNDIDGAIAALSTAVERNPTFTAAFSAWGDILIEAGRAEDALVVLDRGSAVAEPTQAFIIYKNQGKAYMAMDRFEDAITYLESSRKLKPDWPETILLLAQSYDKIGDRGLATPLWEDYLQLETDPVKRNVARKRLGQ